MKVPAPRKLSNGDWYIYLRLDGVGIPVQAEKKEECVKQATAIKYLYKHGEYDPNKGKKVEHGQNGYTLAKLIDSYIEKYSPVLSPSTVRGYGIIRRNRFKAYMDKTAKSIDYQKMVNDELKTASPKTVKNAWGLVSAALKDSGTAVPPVRCAPAPVKELPFLQPEEIGPFLQAIEGDRTETVLLLELNGLRYSEVRALTPDKVNIKMGTITVSGSVVPGPDHQWTAKQTNKNKTSSRTVPIMIPRLKQLLSRSDGLSPSVIQIHPLVCQKRSYAACRQAGITPVSNHDLRRSFVSLCCHLGVPEEQCMLWGGWSDFQTMRKHYVKIANSRKSSSTRKVETFFAKLKMQTFVN